MQKTSIGLWISFRIIQSECLKVTSGYNNRLFNLSKHQFYFIFLVVMSAYGIWNIWNTIFYSCPYFSAIRSFYASVISLVYFCILWFSWYSLSSFHIVLSSVMSVINNYFTILLQLTHAILFFCIIFNWELYYCY